MKQLVVRSVPDAVVHSLKARALRNGRSAEAEHREILRSALVRNSSRTLKEHLLAIPLVGTDAEFSRNKSRRRKVSL